MSLSHCIKFELFLDFYHGTAQHFLVKVPPSGLFEHYLERYILSAVWLCDGVLLFVTTLQGVAIT